MSDVILKLNDICKSFFSVEVLHHVNLELRHGEILGLVGENGAGKSTLMNILGGIFPMSAGNIEYMGEPYEPSSPKYATEKGIAFIHQELNLFTNLSVAENMFIDNFPKGFLGRIDKKKIREKSQEYIEKYDLNVRTSAKMGNLPMGSRQMVEIAKALMKNAKVIIFDEPTTSLSNREKEKLFKTIRDLKASGVSIIYISHILEDVLLLCDRICVLRDGKVVHTDDKERYDRAGLIRYMVGRELTQVYPSIEKEVQETVLEVNDLSCAGFVKDVSFHLRKGEILGMFGLMGAGRTEILRAVFGLDPLESGEIVVFGQEMKKPSPGRCIHKGMAFITENRREEGLLMPRTVSTNLLMVKNEELTGPLGVVDTKAEAGLCRKMVNTLGIKAPHPDRQAANSLSGGNQQKVVMGKWLLKEPKIFLVDEPTHGVDVGAKHEIYRLILNMAKEGSAILVVSSEMQELMGICDRILVLANGRLTSEVQKEEYSQEQIMKFAL
ncbi:sugar ABC transporter ATP-binding protein [Diplocloster hominis]|uniref:sugar ABC transporter ATP-binding protein n=1 Tax=Diplocloster hominis TaxID=3079010 RepID=UPI0031BA1D0F